MVEFKQDFRVAALQTVSTNSVNKNLQQAAELISEAAEKGAELMTGVFARLIIPSALSMML